MAAPAEEETPTTIEETVQFDFNLDIFNNDDGQTDNNLDEFDLELDDQMLLDFVENYESELSIMLESASQHPTRDPTPTSTGQEPDMPPQAPGQQAMKRRHAQMSNEELDELESEKDEENTKQVTKWAVRTLTGKIKCSKKSKTIKVRRNVNNRNTKKGYATIPNPHHAVIIIRSLV